MQITIDVPDYDPRRGLQLVWDDNHVIDVRTAPSSITIKANKPGLVTLARILLTLAQDEHFVGSHVHLDAYGGLEPGSTELLIEKIEGETQP